MQKISIAMLAVFVLVSLTAQADVTSAKQAVANYQLHAKALDPNAVVSAEAGRAFFVKKVVVEGKDLSCSACHTDNPANLGKHIDSGKVIQPMAPSVNHKRFSSVQKAEEKFTEHCKDLYKKDCTAEEKGSFISYLLSVKK